MKIIAETNTRYRAHIHFGFFDPEQIASDDDIRKILVDKGLTNVSVVGEGRERWAFGTWPGPREEIELPGVVTEVVKV